MKSFAELTSTNDSAWPVVLTWLKEAKTACEVLEAIEPNRSNSLVAAQVTTHSTLGAIIYESGGILVENGWLRLLGSGHERLKRSVPKWNFGKSVQKNGEKPEFLLVADDAAGCFFAINAGALGNDEGKMYVFAADTMQWQPMNCGYSEFVHWVITCDLADFYKNLRWPTWREDAANLSCDEAMSFFPPLCFAGEPISNRDRRPVQIEELYWFNVGRPA